VAIFSRKNTVDDDWRNMKRKIPTMVISICHLYIIFLLPTITSAFSFRSAHDVKFNYIRSRFDQLGGRRRTVPLTKLYSGNSFGKLFQISTWGESHGGGVGVTIDGCPPRIPISREEIQQELNMRRPGQSYLTTSRNESDQVEILSGFCITTR
jgi:hypothetical protein